MGEYRPLFKNKHINKKLLIKITFLKNQLVSLADFYKSNINQQFLLIYSFLKVSYTHPFIYYLKLSSKMYFSKKISKKNFKKNFKKFSKKFSKKFQKIFKKKFSKKNFKKFSKKF